MPSRHWRLVCVKLSPQCPWSFTIPEIFSDQQTALQFSLLWDQVNRSWSPWHQEILSINSILPVTLTHYSAGPHQTNEYLCHTMQNAACARVAQSICLASMRFKNQSWLIYMMEHQVEGRLVEAEEVQYIHSRHCMYTARVSIMYSCKCKILLPEQKPVIGQFKSIEIVNWSAGCISLNASISEDLEHQISCFPN